MTSSEDGSYTFVNLAPGTYEVDDPIIVSVSLKSLVVAPIPIYGHILHIRCQIQRSQRKWS